MSEYPGNSVDPQTQVGQYPEATIVRHLKACQRITAEHSRELFEAFLLALEKKLMKSLERPLPLAEEQQLQERVEALRHHQIALQDQFVGSLGKGFLEFKANRLNTHIRQEQVSGELSLVGHEDLEEQIALSSIASRADEVFRELLWFLNQRLAVLNGGRKVQESNNPASPMQFCKALRQTLASLPLDPQTRLLAYREFGRELPSRLGPLLEDVNFYLAGQDILPNLRHIAVGESLRFGSASRDPRAMEKSQSPVASRWLPGKSSARTQAKVPERDPHQQEIIQAIRALHRHITRAGSSSAVHGSPVDAVEPSRRKGRVDAPPPNSGGSPHVISNRQVVAALQALQGEALSLTCSADNVPAGTRTSSIAPAIDPGQQLLEQLEVEGEEGPVDPVDIQTIDLVGLLFDYMLSDEQLPDSVKTILSLLHTPLLKVALLDSSFFEKPEHPARALLNCLAEAGVRWVGNDGTAQYEIYSKIKQTVSRVLETFENDVQLFAELLVEFNSYVKKVAHRQELLEKRATEKFRGEEKLWEVKLRVNQEIRSRTDGRELPSVVLLLLLQPWSDYLAFLLLRYGDQSESWRRGLQAVGDILWSIETKRDSREKVRHRERVGELREVIEGAFDTIGYDQGKAEKLLDALSALQDMALESGTPAPAPAPMRHKLEADAARKAGSDKDETRGMTPEEAKMVESLKRIEFGTWFELDSGKRLKVAWYNSKTMYYMLVDQAGKQVAMKSGPELAREMLSGRARVIAGSSKPFFERALETILENLNAKAEAIGPEMKNG